MPNLNRFLKSAFKRTAAWWPLPIILFMCGCAAGTRPYSFGEGYEKDAGAGTVLANLKIDPAVEEKILALDPEHISAQDVKDTLSKAPAPRIMNVHGGVIP